MTPAELRSWRTESGYSQARLAAKLGVNVGTVSRWERGTRAMSPYLHVVLDVIRERRPRRLRPLRRTEAMEGIQNFSAAKRRGV